jgi:hypothetical protein
VEKAVGRATALRIAEQKIADLFLRRFATGPGIRSRFSRGTADRVPERKAIVLTAMYFRKTISMPLFQAARHPAWSAKIEDADVAASCYSKKTMPGEAWLTRSLMTSALTRLRSAPFQRVAAESGSHKIASLTARERENRHARCEEVINLKRNRGKSFLFPTLPFGITSLQSLAKLRVSNQFELVFLCSAARI